MKSTLLFAALVFLFPASLSARVLKSADGGKALDAEFVRYVASRDTVTLRQANGQNLVVAASKFSEEDRNFFVEAQKEIDKKEGLKVRVKPSNDFSKEETGGLVYSYRTSQYTFEVTNSSESYFEDLELRYWIVLEEQDSKTGKDGITIKSDTKKINSLPGGATESVESPSMKLTLGAKSNACSTCPKVRASSTEKAGSVDRERVIGTKVELVNSKGEVVYSDVSSNRVKSLLAEQKSS